MRVEMHFKQKIYLIIYISMINDKHETPINNLTF